MKRFKILVVPFIFAACVMFVSDPAFAGTVKLSDGKEHEGEIIVRGNVVTLNTKDKKLFQFYLEKVESLSTAEEGKHLLKKQAPLRAEPAEDAKEGVKLSKGMEVEEVERKGNWVKIKGVKEEESGWVNSDLLAKKVDFTDQEKESSEPAGEEIKDATTSE